MGLVSAFFTKSNRIDFDLVKLGSIRFEMKLVPSLIVIVSVLVPQQQPQISTDIVISSMLCCFVAPALCIVCYTAICTESDPLSSGTMITESLGKMSGIAEIFAKTSRYFRQIFT